MIQETAQMLSTNARLFGYESSTIYKSSHQNHPSTIWARQNELNYIWLCELGLALCNEYRRRYGQHKQHKSELVIRECMLQVGLFPDGDWFPPPQVVPDDTTVNITADPLLDCILAYRKLMKTHKRHIAKYDKLGNTPSWL